MVVGIINPSGVDPNRPPPTAVRLLKEVSPFRFAIEALCLGEYPGMEFTDSESGGGGWLRKLKNLPRMGAMAMIQNGDQVIEALGLHHQTYKGAMIQLAWLSVRFLGISWLGLQVEAIRAAQRPSTIQQQEYTAISKVTTGEDATKIVDMDGKPQSQKTNPPRAKIPLLRRI